MKRKLDGYRLSLPSEMIKGLKVKRSGEVDISMKADTIIIKNPDKVDIKSYIEDKQREYKNFYSNDQYKILYKDLFDEILETLN